MKPFPVALLAAALPLAMAQSVRLVPDLAVAENEYRTAQELWLKNDPGLEQDLYKGKPAEIRRRIERAAALRDDMMAKKEVYLDFLVKRFGEISGRVTGVKNSKIPVAQLRTDLLAEQSRLLGQQERIESMLQDLPAGDEYILVRRAMEEEKTSLINLQNDMALRIRSLDKIGLAQDAAPDLQPLEQKFDEMKTLWAQERDAAIRQRATWARYYAQMEKSLEEPNGPRVTAPTAAPSNPALPPGANPAPTQPVKANPSPVNAAPLSPAPASPAPAPAAVQNPPFVPAFSGTWSYRSQPGAWAGFAEPEGVLLKIEAEADRLQGVYSARLPGRDDIRDVTLTLRGRLLSPRQAVLEWTSERPPASGEIRLELASDGKMLVRRTKSGDSYIPLGSEVLMPK